MNNTLAVSIILTLAAFASPPSDAVLEPASAPDAAAPVTTEALLANPTSYAASACGAHLDCGTEEHEVIPHAQGHWNGTHECWGPLEHSGPQCLTQTRLDLEDIRNMTLPEIRFWTAENPGSNVVFRAEYQAIDLLNCARSLIVARVPFSQIADD